MIYTRPTLLLHDGFVALQKWTDIRSWTLTSSKYKWKVFIYIAKTEVKTDITWHFPSKYILIVDMEKTTKKHDGEAGLAIGELLL